MDREGLVHWQRDWGECEVVIPFFLLLWLMRDGVSCTIYIFGGYEEGVHWSLR